MPRPPELRRAPEYGSHAPKEAAGPGWVEMRGMPMKRALGLRATLAAAAMYVGAEQGWAAAGHPEPWQMNLQDAVTPVAESLHSLHSFLLVIITVISAFVLALLIYVMVKFNAKANPVPSRTTHNTLIEVAWTVVPILILVAIAIPSMRLLFMQRVIPQADMTIKVIGNPSWNWTYEYPDLGLNDDKTAKVSFTSYLKPREDAEKEGVPYLLATDVPVVVPVNKTVKMIVTSDPEGIIHAWTIQSFGMKIDAIPGRLNEDWFKATKEGVYYGQCSELCGMNHAYMPIEVWVVDEKKAAAWADLIKTQPQDDVYKDFLKTIKPATDVVAAK
jgi:cytochrome c oxidase subunit II